MRARWLTAAPSKEPRDTRWGACTSAAFVSARGPAVKSPRASGVKGGWFPGKQGEGVMDGPGNSALPVMFPGAVVSGEPVSWWGVVVAGGGVSPESHSWQHPGEQGRGRRFQDGGEMAVSTEQLPSPLSPCEAVPYSLRSTLEKIDCLFLPDCPRVTGCRGGGRGGGGRGGLLPPHQDGFFCFSACRKSRNRIREAAQGVITVRRARACRGRLCDGGRGGRVVGAERALGRLWAVASRGKRLSHLSAGWHLHHPPSLHLLIFPSFLPPGLLPSLLPVFSPFLHSRIHSPFHSTYSPNPPVLHSSLFPGTHIGSAHIPWGLRGMPGLALGTADGPVPDFALMDVTA